MMANYRLAYIVLLSKKFKGHFRASFRRVHVMRLHLIDVDVSSFTHEQLKCVDCTAATGAYNSKIILR
jgi:hypothetical protein